MSDEVIEAISDELNKGLDDVTTYKIPIAHAAQCPLAIFFPEGAIGEAHPDHHVQLAVVVVCFRKKEVEGKLVIEVVLTQRAAHMSAFPNIWVCPGGHVDPGETIEQAGARELLEETGLVVDAESMEPFFVWESVYPAYADQGETRRHHFV
eukprot:TRINITY_DN5916_c0_g1_i1.p1 TRINITY_DN5916_c0_g1~~TRINITY_DN5916_c0_g1_i1.p1  ORF type:complete len:169 (+),score=37.49 TRINITY_DN5916_c0_g1_i1:56-508(+)